MQPTDEALRELYQQTTGATSGDDCPTPESLSSLAAGDLAGDDRDRLLDHLTTCSSCAQEVRVLRTLKPWAHEVADELQLATEVTPNGPRPVDSKPTPVQPMAASEPSRSWTGAGWRSSLLAAGLATVLFGGYALQSFQASPPTVDVVRGPAEAAVHPPTDSQWNAAPARFSWPAQQGATGYRLHLFDGEAETLWQGETVSATSSSLSIGALQQLQPGRSYFWTVEVSGPVRQGSLGPFWFHLEALPE